MIPGSGMWPKLAHGLQAFPQATETAVSGQMPPFVRLSLDSGGPARAVRGGCFALVDWRVIPGARRHSGFYCWLLLSVMMVLLLVLLYIPY